ncbi:MAG: hypothetical protein ACJ8F3_02935, partial [Xanthobacteraceae bacterium]
YGDGTPLKLVVFLAGASVVRTETKGERPDVTAALGLDFGSEKNVAFKMTFDCEHGQQPVVVGLGVRRQYLPLTATACP